MIIITRHPSPPPRSGSCPQCAWQHSEYHCNGLSLDPCCVVAWLGHLPSNGSRVVASLTGWGCWGTPLWRPETAISFGKIVYSNSRTRRVFDIILCVDLPHLYMYNLICPMSNQISSLESHCNLFVCIESTRSYATYWKNSLNLITESKNWLVVTNQ